MLEKKDKNNSWYIAGIYRCIIVLCMLLYPGDAIAQEQELSDNWYPVSNFICRYQYQGNSVLPDIEQINQLKIKLYELSDGISAAGKDGSEIEYPLNELAGTVRSRFHLTAIKSIQDQLVKYLNSHGISGVVVMPAPGQIDLKTLKDLRSDSDSNQQKLVIDIWVAKIVEIKGKYTTEQYQESDKYKKSLQRIVVNSPIGVVPENDPNSNQKVQTDQLRTDLLEDYLSKVNRHPGRRVDAAVGPGDEPGEVCLDYNIRQNKPWLGYMQASNTGSKDTNDFRQRYGIVNNQLTGNDDIFNLDYLTTDYSSVHSVNISYDRPWYDSQDARFKIWGSWSEYVSSEIGSASYFSGGEQTLGVEMSDNIYQKKRLFIDHFAGLRFSRYKIKNYIIDGEMVEASESMIIPQLGYRLEFDSGLKRTYGEVMLEFNLSGNDNSEMQDFGRLYPESDWYKLSWNYSHSFYLEPALNPKAWRDSSTPNSSTLAHELAFTTRGQFCSARLIPQEKHSVGGLYTVRGYRQGSVSGDNVFIFSGEYRYHIPRSFDLAKPVKLPVFGGKFRWAPEQVYGFPDWDLIFRSFIDAAMVRNSHKVTNEDDYSLLSCGLGLEMQFNRYFSLRCDWGVALQDIENNNGDKTDIGDSEVHITGMLAY